MSHASRLSLKALSLLSLCFGVAARGATLPPESTGTPANTSAVTARVHDRGAAPEETPSHLLLTLRRSPEQERALDQLLRDQADPKSPSFHKWLTPQQFGKRFGASEGNLDSVKAYVQSQGMTVGRVYGDRMAVEVSGTVGQVHSAFGKEVHRFTKAGRSYYAAVGATTVPSELASALAGVVSAPARSESAAPQSTRATFDQATHRAHPLATSISGASYAIAPGDLQAIYDIPTASGTGLGGKGVTIGVVGDSNINITNITNYQSTFALPQVAPQVIVDGNDPGVTSDAIIAYKQLEVLSAVAPNATIKYYVSADVSQDTNLEYASGLDFAIIRALEDNAIQVLLIGYQQCEANLGMDENSFINQAWKQAAAQGITVVAAAGNSGAYACDTPGDTGTASSRAVNAYASSPYVTAVGGTDFFYFSNGNTAANYWNTTNTNFASAKGYIPEQAWNSTTNAGGSQANLDGSNPAFLAGGGGISSMGSVVYPNADFSGTPTQGPYPMPAYQMQIVPSSISTSARVIPDIAFFAGEGPGFTEGPNDTAYLFCISDADCQGGTTPFFTLGGGTEASSAVFAGSMALVLQHDFASTNYRIGNANPTLYNYAKNFSPGTQTSTVYYHDVTGGNNNMSGATGYAAAAKYDAVTGIGSLDIANLINSWPAPNTIASSVSMSIQNYFTGSSVTTIPHSTPVTFSAAVSSLTELQTPATGDIAFYTTSPLAAQAAIAAFTVSSTNSTVTSPAYFNLPGGTYQIYARYSGDQSYAASISAPQTITVTAETSKLEVLSGLHNVYYAGDGTGLQTIPYGAPVIVSVEPFSTSGFPDATSIPSGSIVVKDNGTTIATLPINSAGAATFTSSSLALGNHSLVFSYSGDLSFSASNTSLHPVAFSVGQAATTTTILSSDANSHSTYGAANTYTIIVAPAPFTSNGTVLRQSGVAPTGVVNFTTSSRGSNSTLQATLKASYDAQGNSVSTATITPTFPGSPTTYTAIYGGDTNYSASSNSLNVSNLDNDGNGTSTITFNNFLTTAYITRPYSVNVSVSTTNAFGTKVTPTEGTVTLFANGASIGSQPYTGPALTFNLPSTNGFLKLPTGSVVITAQYTSSGVSNCYFVIFCTADPEDISASNTVNVIDDRTSTDFSLSSDITVNDMPSTPQSPMSATNTSAKYNLQLSSLYKFPASTSIALSCALVNAPGLQCSLASTALTLGTTGTATTSVTVSAVSGYTIAGGTAPAAPSQRWWRTGGGAALACVLLAGIPASRRRWQASLGALLTLIIITSLSGCGNVGSNVLSGGNGTTSASGAPVSSTPGATSGATPNTGTVGTGTDNNNLGNINGSNGTAGLTPAVNTVPAGMYTMIVTASATSSSAAKVVHNLPLQIMVQ